MSIYSYILIAVIAAWIYVLVWLSLWRRSLKLIRKELQNAIWDTQKIYNDLRRTVETVEILKRAVLSPKTQDEEFIKTIDAQIARQKQQEYEARQHAEDHPKRRKLDQ